MTKDDIQKNLKSKATVKLQLWRVENDSKQKLTFEEYKEYDIRPDLHIQEIETKMLIISVSILTKQNYLSHAKDLSLQQIFAFYFQDFD